MTVLVVGGGITGLSSAHALGKAGIPTILLERSSRLGGKVRTELVDGFVIEHGPDSFVSYRPAATHLAHELGLADELVRPQEPRIVFVRSRGRFVRFPDGMGLVLPTKFRPFVTSDLFSPLEKLRMALDLVLPRDGTEGDLAIGPFLRRRLGCALVDRLAGPLIGGVYGTAIDELSVDAVVPQLRESERRHRSLLLATVADARARAKAARAAAPGAGGVVIRANPPSPFVTLSGGTGQLVEALIDAIATLPSVTIRTESAVRSLEVDSFGATVRLDNGELLRGDGLILASPAPVTASLLADVVPEAARQVREIPHGSTAVVNLAYRDDQLGAHLDGHGFLVADDEPLMISACTLSSRKWAGRAPDGSLLVRAFLGSNRPAAHRLADGALVDAVHADVAGLLGIRGRPVLSRVSRFPDAMPKYTVGHLDRVASAEAALARVPAVQIAGGAYRGVGLPDCIAQGRDAADAIMAHLARGMERQLADERHASASVSSRSDQPRKAAAAPAARHLDELPTGSGATILTVSDSHATELAMEGLQPGSRITIKTRAPLGGPLVVGVGRARVAVARSVAAGIAVAPDSSSSDDIAR